MSPTSRIATIKPNTMQSDTVRTQKVLLGFRDAQPFKKNKALLRPRGHEKIPAFRQLADEEFKDGRHGHSGFRVVFYHRKRVEIAH